MDIMPTKLIGNKIKLNEFLGKKIAITNYEKKQSSKEEGNDFYEFQIIIPVMKDGKKTCHAYRSWNSSANIRCFFVCDYYLSNRGIPALDGAFTIFGEVKDGLDVVERIEHVPTNDERPLTDVTVLKAIVTKDADTGGWVCMASYADAFCLAADVKPHISFDGDSLYTIHDWYGVKGYDLKFKTKVLNDSVTIDVVNAESYRSGYYYVKTGLEDMPMATVYPGMFVETSTICSGFNGNKEKGKVWAYVYLYSPQRQWKGGHLYKLWWGEQPPQPIWSVNGKCSLVGNVPDITATLEAYADGRYILRNWYGVEKYDLEFRVLPNGGIDVLDYYWVENNCRYVQCRRDDIGTAAIPMSDDKPNGGLLIEGNHGRLHFAMTAIANDDTPIADGHKKEFVFTW